MGKSFTFIFHDRQWPDKLVGGAFVTVLSCFGVGLPFLMAYFQVVFDRTLEGSELILPEWKEVVPRWREGLKLAGAALFFCLPCLFLGLFLVGLPLLASRTPDMVIVGNLPAHVDTFRMPALARVAAQALLPVGILTLFFLPAVMVHTAARKTPLAVLEFTAIARLAVMGLPQYANCLVTSLLAFLISLTGALGLGVGLFLTFFWACLVTTHVFAESHRSRSLLNPSS